MPNAYSNIAFTDAVKDKQTALGSRRAYAEHEARPEVSNSDLGEAEAIFLSQRDSAVEFWNSALGIGGRREEAALIRRLRAAGQVCGRRVAIMADLPGPKMRIGRFAGRFSFARRRGADRNDSTCRNPALPGRGAPRRPSHAGPGPAPE